MCSSLFREIGTMIYELYNESFKEAGRLQMTDRHPNCDQRLCHRKHIPRQRENKKNRGNTTVGWVVFKDK